MIKLKDLLFEQTEDLKPLAMDLLRQVKTIVGPGPAGRGSIHVAWTTKHQPEITILYDTPREIRHPEDYDIRHGVDPAIDKKVLAWHKFDDTVWSTLNRFQKKHKGIRVGAAGNISGASIKSSGRPTMANL